MSSSNDQKRRRLTRRTGTRLLALATVGAQVALTLAACRPSEAAPANGAAAARAGAAEVVVAAPAAEPPRSAVEVAPAAGASLALQQAQTRLRDGNYRRALEDFAAVQESYPGTAEAAEAAFRRGEAALADDQFVAAEDSLRRAIGAYPDHPRRPVALLMLGRALEGRSLGPAAVAAYRQYVESGRPSGTGGSPGTPPSAETLDAAGAGLAADVMHLGSATIYFGEGRVAEGWAELGQATSAAERSGSATAKARVYDVLGQRYMESGNRDQAVAAWQVAFDSAVSARRPARTIAEAAWRLVGAYQVMGRRDLADALRWRIVGEWPRTFTAQQAMTDLGPTLIPASQRGLIAYSNRRWPQAVEAYTTYINAGAPEGNLEEARYYRAVALTRQGDDAALEALDRVADLHAQSPWASEALWEAGSLLLRRGDPPAALARFERLAAGYPASARRGQALYWLGKLLPDNGNVAAGQRYMEAAAASGYEDYYTFRARSALRRPTTSPKPLEDQVTIGESERATWTQWLAARGRTPEAQAERRAQLNADPRFRRGTVLLEAGFRKEAEDEFREVLEAYGNDVVALEHVAVHVRARGLYPYSVTLGHRMFESLNAMGETSLLDAPRVVQKLILPLAFLDLVAQSARQNGLDPLLMLGMMKQESWFEPRAASSANARGLTQFILPTAKAVAEELQWPNWTWDDMNRPYVSVPFGAHYLSSLLRSFRGNYHYALAGYNGGPGNVLKWAKGDWNRDLDLFVEEIGFFETRGYVKSVTGNYELYKAIYYR